MTAPALPEDVRGFIERSIESVEEIEILGLLEAIRPRSWSASEIGAELRTTTSSAASRLARLKSLGFLQLEAGTDERYVFAPRDPEADAMASKVLWAYKGFPVTVVTLIFSKPSVSIKDFADAFRLKKKDQENG